MLPVQAPHSNPVFRQSRPGKAAAPMVTFRGDPDTMVSLISMGAALAGWVVVLGRTFYRIRKNDPRTPDEKRLEREAKLKALKAQPKTLRWWLGEGIESSRDPYDPTSLFNRRNFW